MRPEYKLEKDDPEEEEEKELTEEDENILPGEEIVAEGDELSECEESETEKNVITGKRKRNEPERYDGNSTTITTTTTTDPPNNNNNNNPKKQKRGNKFSEQEDTPYEKWVSDLIDEVVEGRVKKFMHECGVERVNARSFIKEFTEHFISIATVYVDQAHKQAIYRGNRSFRSPLENKQK